MNRTKKTITIVAALAGILMLTAATATAAPHWVHKHHKHWLAKHHKPGLSIVIGRRFTPRLRKRYVPAHVVTDYKRVLVAPGHYEMQTRKVLVQAAHFETKIIPAVTKTVTQPDGTTNVVVLQPAQTTQVWVPDRYVTRTTKVWVPARYETRAYKRVVPGHWTY